MTAAAQVLQQQRLSGRVLLQSLSKENIVMTLLVSLVLVSAISVIYVKYMNRQLISEVTMQQQTAQQLQVEWGKLLLQKGALSAPSRIQNIANNSLNMYVPRAKNVIMIKI